MLARTVTYTRADLVPPDPVAASHLATGLTWRQLCQAAIEQSDNTAANLVVGALGGPRAVTRYARQQLGDHVTRLDRTEPTLNQATPGDPRDTPRRKPSQPTTRRSSPSPAGSPKPARSS